MNRETVLDRGSPLVPRSGDSRPRAAWNLGQVLGLRGLASLAPLLGLWAIVAGVWLGWEKRLASRSDLS